LYTLNPLTHIPQPTDTSSPFWLTSSNTSTHLSERSFSRSFISSPVSPQTPPLRVLPPSNSPPALAH
jgi:hypothetical protein